jgi:hypothetical protein
VAFLTPGLRFFHQGQFDGRRERASIHLNRAPAEQPDPAVGEFYARLLEVLKHPALRDGAWLLLEPAEAWQGNRTWDGFVCFAWEGPGEDPRDERLLGAVNFQPYQAQCYVHLPFPALAGRAHDLVGQLGPARHRREGDELTGRGLYLDLPAWGHHLFRLDAIEAQGG